MTTRMRHLIVVAIAGAGLATFSVTANADVSFKTPSNNIGCYGTSTEVRCDIRTSSAKRPPKPRSCRADWGTAFELTRTGRGHGRCVSDSALPYPGSGMRTLRYGTSIRVNNRITCTSRTTGLTCRNTRGHGFLLSKTKIRLY